MANRILGALAAFFAACLLMVGNACAESRIALIIGNSEYQSVGRLPNPTNDARAIANALQAVDFEVQTATDLTRLEMGRALSRFANTVAAKGKDAVALVFYAGHGLQIEGENYLVPIDANLEREADVPLSTMRLVDIVKALETLPTKMRIVILDACRNNPFGALRKSSGRGLAIVDAPAGSIVAYSTSPGAEALDGTGANSPYTSALVEVMKEPGLAIEQVFKGVRVRVNKVTEGRQVPWESSSLTANFAFIPGQNPVIAVNPPPRPALNAPPSPVIAANAPAVPALNTPSAPVAAPVSAAAVAPAQIVNGEQDFSAVSRQRVSEIATRPVEEAYEITIEENSIEAFDEFIRAYEDDPRAIQVKRLLARRNQMVAWRNAVVSNDTESYEAYLSLYPDSDHAAAAARLRERPRFRPIDPVIARPVFLPLSNRLKFGNSNNVINQAINRLGGNRGNFQGGSFGRPGGGNFPDRNSPAANNRPGGLGAGFPNRGQNVGPGRFSAPSGPQASTNPNAGRPSGTNPNSPPGNPNNPGNANSARPGGINPNVPPRGQNSGDVQTGRPGGINPNAPVSSPINNRGQQQVNVPPRVQQPPSGFQQRQSGIPPRSAPPRAAGGGGGRVGVSGGGGRGSFSGGGGRGGGGVSGGGGRGGGGGRR